jgi:hypothetical protein
MDYGIKPVTVPEILIVPDIVAALAPEIVYAPYELTVESDNVLVPAITFSVVTVELMVMVLLDPERDVPVVQPVPLPLVAGVAPFSV